MGFLSNLFNSEKPECPKLLMGCLVGLGLITVAIVSKTDASIYALAGYGMACFGISGYEKIKSLVNPASDVNDEKL